MSYVFMSKSVNFGHWTLQVKPETTACTN